MIEKCFGSLFDLVFGKSMELQQCLATNNSALDHKFVHKPVVSQNFPDRNVMNNFATKIMLF